MLARKLQRSEKKVEIVISCSKVKRKELSGVIRNCANKKRMDIKDPLNKISSGAEVFEDLSYVNEKGYVCTKSWLVADGWWLKFWWFLLTIGTHRFTFQYSIEDVNESPCIPGSELMRPCKPFISSNELEVPWDEILLSIDMKAVRTAIKGRMSGVNYPLSDSG